MTMKLYKSKKNLSIYLSEFIYKEEIWKMLKPISTPEIMCTFENLFLWSSKYIENLIEEKENPLPNSGLSEEGQICVKIKSGQWLAQTEFVYQGEEYFKKEAERLNKPYRWKSWTDLNEHLIYEEFVTKVFYHNSDFWESLPAKIHNKSLKDTIKYFEGCIHEKDTKDGLKAIEEKQSKLKTSFDEKKIIEILMDWNIYCTLIGKKYKRHLPAFLPWLRACSQEIPCKLAIVNGRIVQYPGRGKNKD